MAGRVTLSLVIHIHQPVGNFDHVMEAAYSDCYLPFADALREHATVPHTLHVSGCLLEWMEEHHPEFIDRLKELVQMGRVELMASGFFEPVLTMLTPRDRIDQINMMRNYLGDHFQSEARSAWVTERVWEQYLVKDLVDCGIENVVVDDFHFKAAGLREEDLAGYYLTEDSGRLLAVFPGSERMRYLVPFRPVEEVIDYLASFRELDRPVIVYADDGEKFGVWPGTREHVFDKGWLRRFYQVLEENRSWLEVVPLSAALGRAKPRGRIYLPDASYREMTEWALPPEALTRFRKAEEELKDNDAFLRLRPFIRGGTWRNFRHKYPEIDWMYARMIRLSNRTCSDAPGEARTHLLRSQCNCAWWHGVFGGFYLPHLRRAVWQELLAAERLCPQPAGSGIEIADFDLDLNEEARLFNPSLNLFVDPQGGLLRELDIRNLNLNLSDTLARRYEAYHEAIHQQAEEERRSPGDGSEDDDAESIHDRIHLKEANLGDFLVYDPRPLYSLVDVAATKAPSARELSLNEAPCTNWAGFEYDCEYSEDEQSVSVTFEREGSVIAGNPVSLRIIKQITLSRTEPSFHVELAVEPFGGDGEIVCGLLSYFNLLSDQGTERGAAVNGEYHGLSEYVEAAGETLVLFDQWQGFRLEMRCGDDETPLWRTFPVYTVSSSESGLERVYQATGVAAFFKTPLKRYEPIRHHLEVSVHADSKG